MNDDAARRLAARNRVVMGPDSGGFGGFCAVLGAVLGLALLGELLVAGGVAAPDRRVFGGQAEDRVVRPANENKRRRRGGRRGAVRVPVAPAVDAGEPVRRTPASFPNKERTPNGSVPPA